MKYQYGDVGFVQNNALISKIMRGVMGSKWSHSFMVIGELNGETYVIETSDFEVTINKLDRYLDGRPCEIYRPYEGVKINDTTILLGKIYGYPQLISLGIRRLFYKLFVMRNFFTWSYVCYQVPAYAHKDHLKMDFKNMDTEDFYQLVKKNFDLVDS